MVDGKEGVGGGNSTNESDDNKTSLKGSTPTLFKF